MAMIRQAKASVHLPKIKRILLAVIAFCGLPIPLIRAVSESMPLESTQKAFNTPQQAAQALIQAASAFDVATLMEILGPDGKDLVATANPIDDKSYAADFAVL